MSEMLIEKGIVIDNVEAVKAELEYMIGKDIPDMGIVKKFISTEKNTKYYIDRKLQSFVKEESDCRFLWLDSGFTDRNGMPIFISLPNRGQEYRGHYVATAKKMSESFKGSSNKINREITTNYSRFVNKYKNKCEERDNQHIFEINDYLLKKANNESEQTNEFAAKLLQLNVEWAKDEDEVTQTDVVEEAAKIEQESFTEKEEEITIGLLFDILAKREVYIEELLEKISAKDDETKELVETIKAQSKMIKEQDEAFTRIRMFCQTETENQNRREIEKQEREEMLRGHNLLAKNKKIAIVGGTNLSAEVMRAIVTKEYGFKEEDFEYETDYTKIVHSAERIINSSRYQAIIFGSCPHSVSGKGAWSSVIERCKRIDKSIITVDARNTSGNLRVTKESFRKALKEICDKITKVA
jgi:hypothetical protein